MEFIKYSEVLYLMDKLDDQGLPVPFSFISATASGRFLEMKRAVKNVLDKKEEDLPKIKAAGKKAFKPDHNRAAKKMWIDIKNLDTEEIKRIYPRTIINFNGFKLSFDI
jgi:hypothetical protein